jgi:hypothetical protein
MGVVIDLMHSLHSCRHSTSQRVELLRTTSALTSAFCACCFCRLTHFLAFVGLLVTTSASTLHANWRVGAASSALPSRAASLWCRSTLTKATKPPAAAQIAVLPSRSKGVAGAQHQAARLSSGRGSSSSSPMVAAQDALRSLRTAGGDAYGVVVVVFAEEPGRGQPQRPSLPWRRRRRSTAGRRSLHGPRRHDACAGTGKSACKHECWKDQRNAGAHCQSVEQLRLAGRARAGSGGCKQDPHHRRDASFHHFGHAGVVDLLIAARTSERIVCLLQPSPQARRQHGVPRGYTRPSMSYASSGSTLH